ncbi:MAG: phosphate acetyltransferase [Longimicrobiales bacterium]
MTGGSFREQIQIRASLSPRRIVLPESGDERVLEAAVRLHRAGLAHPVLIGDSDAITAALREHADDAGDIEIIDPATDHRRAALGVALAELRSHRGWTEADAFARIEDPLVYAGALVHSGYADGFVAGAVRTTGDVVRAALWSIGTAPGIRTVSSSFYMVVPPFREQTAAEVLTFTDAGIVAYPDARALADIAAAAVTARRLIVGDTPRVAFLSFSSRGSAQGTSVTRVREAFEIFRSEYPDVLADGELQADAALIQAVADRKAPGSAIGGMANILVFPDLDAGNIAYKLVQRLARAEALGPILQGMNRPCSDLSRGATTDDIVDVACVTALQAQAAPILPYGGQSSR